MTEKCFAKCISKPGSSLDSSEQVMKIKLCFNYSELVICEFLLSMFFLLPEMCSHVYGSLHGCTWCGINILLESTETVINVYSNNLSYLFSQLVFVNSLWINVLIVIYPDLK